MEELTRSQLMIMKCVWDYDGNISYMELMDDLRKRFGKDYHRSTLVTFLAQMEEKGYVSTYRKSKFAYVVAEISEDEYKKKYAEDNTNFLFKGKPADYLASLFAARGVREQDVEEIRRLLDELAD